MRACSVQVWGGEIQVWEWVRWVEHSDGSQQNRLRVQGANLNLFIAATTQRKKTLLCDSTSAELATKRRQL